MEALNMGERNNEAPAEEKNILETAPNVEETESLSVGDSRDVDTCIKEDRMPSQKQEEEMVKKKYGGLLSKKPPLISKDNERAFFDSADWALGKKSKGPLEALRPKLQPTPHHPVRSRSPCAPSDDDGEDDCSSDDTHDSALDGVVESSNNPPEDHNMQSQS